MPKQTLSDDQIARTREIVFNGKKQRVEIRSVSAEAIKLLGKNERREIVAHFPLNPAEIEKEIRLYKAKTLRMLAMMNGPERADFMAKPPIDFVRDHGDRIKFKIQCQRCGDIVATVWAKNEFLEDWCDLHYMAWHDKQSWHGCMAVNQSPIDGWVGFECACGEDTRDARMAKGLPPIAKELLIEYTEKHRELGTKDSTFKLKR